MAGCAECRKPGRQVTGIRGFVEIRQVAAGAIGWSSSELAANVALAARQANMRARQGKLGGRAVIEDGACPRGGVVADVAGGREGSRGVRGIVGASEILLMAANAGCRGQLVVVVDVALCARDGGMETRQGEAGSRVVEGHTAPLRCRVAPLACGRLSRRHVVGLLRVLVILHMAPHAIRRQACSFR